ncbi:hydrogenase maturation protease [Frateuria defendens]|uniref:hydrogenase maturation protease n=1 Tax=Frateuria defendens TaxID=2219559 RepID=UPI00066FEBA7|nr:hydrogenase maturation protease [Frateuria defendens]
MLLVMGCGNPVRQDDGAGPEVIARLHRRLAPPPAGLRLVDAGSAGMDVVYALRGVERAVIVDACRSGSRPGEVFRLPAREALRPQAPLFSQHGLRWDHALYAAGQLNDGGFLDRVEVFLIEAEHLGYGIGLSTSVEQGVQRTVEALAAMIEGRR